MKNKMVIDKELLEIYYDKIGETVMINYKDKQTKAKICEIEINEDKTIKVVMDYELNDVTNEIFKELHSNHGVSVGYELDNSIIRR
jgi:hypothetical protein